MHVISKRPFNDAKKKFPTCAEALDATYKTLHVSRAKNPEELKALFPSLGNCKYRDKLCVIDICGNKLRLMAYIKFTKGRLYVKHIVTHVEYDKIIKAYRSERKK
ncbi:type II toxin-antitoxin system HigB family toxin [Vibrio owensii]|uniref:Cytoplasmic protein n=2 Tax=Vibrio owensii TaxID=696485 RepID=A0A0C1YKM3_9VIBR|nr:type II toxin-antitoxin system HigB family toxin [Vibrio owensii]KIF44664.1 cytoplasmic protein [Vibrio owensii CAIM 1854 = LMG 25443]